MERSKPEVPGQEPFYYQNGQSDAEKLLRQRLASDEAVPHEELNNVKVGVNDLSPEEQAFEESAEAASEGADEDGDGDASLPPTPWGVLGE